MNLIVEDSKLINFKVKLWAYESKELTEAIEKIKSIPLGDNGYLKGPIPLPTKIRRWCLLKSPHVNKKSREPFEARRHSRLLNIFITGSKIDQYGKDLCKVGFPAGVRMEVSESRV